MLFTASLSCKNCGEDCHVMVLAGVEYNKSPKVFKTLGDYVFNVNVAITE